MQDPLNFDADADPDPGSALGKNGSGSRSFQDLLNCYNKNNFQIFCFFSLIFIIKLNEPFRNEEIFIISLFSEVQIWVSGVKKIVFFAVYG